MKFRKTHAIPLFVAMTLAACGARTALLVPDELDASTPDAGKDARPDRHDAGIDVHEEDAPPPPIDANLPDVPVVNVCPDAGSTLIYLLGEQNDLFSFYPPTLSLTNIGKVACGSQAFPFSMAVDRLGTAYSVFDDGTLFQISTANASCKPTKFQPNQDGFLTFGMSFATTAKDGGDSLYVIQVDFMSPSKGLATIDTQSFLLSFVSAFQPDLTPECELTGTGDGRLFALCLSPSGGSSLAQIDPTNGKILGIDSLQVGSGQEALAFGIWGGEFWIFTSPGTTTDVTRYDPIKKIETPMTTLNAVIVGAGVSTCAPQ